MLTPILLVLAISYLLWVCYALDRARWREFKKQFPPITDEEFLARCRPGVNAEVALKVRRIFARNLDVEYERRYPSSRIAEDLGAD